MTHYEEHRRLALTALDDARQMPEDTAPRAYAAAQAHATLALAAATAEPQVLTTLEEYSSPIDLVLTERRCRVCGCTDGRACVGGCAWSTTSLCTRCAPAQYVYVASSWRNDIQPAVVEGLRAAGVEVYDFKNPGENGGFHWSDVGLQRERDLSSAVDYLRALEHPRSVAGYESDFAAMQRADTFVLVLPCGRSAHLELGWAVGKGKRTAIVLDDPCTPELMYRMVDALLPTVDHAVQWAVNGS